MLKRFARWILASEIETGIREARKNERKTIIEEARLRRQMIDEITKGLVNADLDELVAAGAVVGVYFEITRGEKSKPFPGFTIEEMKDALQRLAKA